MKRFIIIAVILMLAGCNSDSKDCNCGNNTPKHNYSNVLYYGDELCYAYGATVEDYSLEQGAPARLGFTTECIIGRSIKNQDIPDGYDVTIIHLGSNDVAYQDVNQFKIDYQNVIDNLTTGRLICVLPNTTVDGFDATQYRQAILEICSETIDPIQARVLFEAVEGRMSVKDHDMWYDALLGIVQ